MADEKKALGATGATGAGLSGATGGATGAILAQEAPKAKTESPQPAPAKGATVAIKDIVGQDAGFTVDVGAEGPELEGDELGIRRLAARITGWSDFQIDGERYEYSEANALALLNRFPYIREQLASAG